MGRPVKERVWVEERLNHRVRIWANPNETMSLDGYNIDRKGALLTADLTIKSERWTRC